MRLNLTIDAPLLLGAAVFGVGALLAGYSHRLRLPASLLFLGLGMLIGDDGLGIVSFDDPDLVQNLGVVALIVILYEGGLTTKPSDLRRAAVPGFLLSNVGVVITAVITAAGAMLLIDVELHTAFLLGAVVASTDAAAVFDLLRRTPLPRRLGAVLEVESGANDPFAIMLTVGLLTAWQHGAGAGDWLAFAAVQLFGGLVVGASIGLAGGLLLRRVELNAVGLYPVLALALAGVSYGLAALVGASGFLAVYLTGLLVGALIPRYRRIIRNFLTSLANTAEIGLFLLLGLLVFPSQLPPVVVPAAAVAAVLFLLARPAAVAVCLTPFRIGWREQAVVAWAGLRGAVPIVLATFPFTAGYPAGDVIFNVVFFVVILSILLQGLTVAPLVRRIGLDTGHPAWESIAEALPLEGVDADFVEVTITDDLHVAGRTLREAPLGPGMLLTTIVRGQQVIIPTGDTRLLAGDLAVVAAPRNRRSVQRVTAWARGETAAGTGDELDAAD